MLWEVAKKRGSQEKLQYIGGCGGIKIEIMSQRGLMNFRSLLPWSFKTAIIVVVSGRLRCVKILGGRSGVLDVATVPLHCCHCNPCPVPALTDHHTAGRPPW